MGLFSTFTHQQSLTGSCPVFPPNTIKNGLVNVSVCPYRLPGVVPTTGTTVHDPVSSDAFKSNKYKSSEAKLPLPPVAPPYITS